MKLNKLLLIFVTTIAANAVVAADEEKLPPEMKFKILDELPALEDKSNFMKTNVHNNYIVKGYIDKNKGKITLSYNVDIQKDLEDLKIFLSGTNIDPKLQTFSILELQIIEDKEGSIANIFKNENYNFSKLENLNLSFINLSFKNNMVVGFVKTILI